MNKKTIVLKGVGIGLMLLTACTNPQRVIPGTWTIVQAKIDGQDEITITDSNQDPNCGQINASATMKIDGGKITFNKDETYSMSSTSKSLMDYRSDCISYQWPITYTDTVSGTWTLISKNTILLKPNDPRLYPVECTIVKLKRKKMTLKCPCLRNCEIDLLGDGDVDYVVGETELYLEK